MGARPHRLRVIISAFMAGVTVVLGLPLLLARVGADPLAIAMLLTLAASYVGPTAVLYTQKPRWIAAVQLLCGGLASASLGALVIAAGGTQHPFFQATLALPLALTMICPETPLVALVSGASAGLFGALTFHLEGRPPLDVFMLASLGVSAGVVGSYGGFIYWRMKDAELRAATERNAALTELAMLQRQHSEAERLATIGRIAADVAHEINNPLAYVSANLAFLKLSLSSQQPNPITPELDGVMGETAEGVERITRIVRELTDLARPAAQSQTDS